jgi:putative ABC transport system substrate-binding protein
MPVGRRSLVLASVAAVVGALPRAAAQRTGVLPRIGFLTPGPNPREEAFWQGMRELGYVDGKSILVDRRSAEGDFARLPALAAELVKARPYLIVAIGSAATVAAKQATLSIPIVMVGTTDPVAAGLVESLARPGGNVTGTSSQTTRTIGKLLELVRQLLPDAKRVAALWDPVNVISQQLRIGETLIAAAKLHLIVRPIEIHSRDDLERAFRASPGERIDAALIAGDTFFLANASRVADLAIQHRLPVFAPSRILAEAGVLATYASDFAAYSRRAAIYVQKILKGARPGDLAVELPSKFELVINERTAKAIGVVVPSALLARADEVIR